MRVLLFITSERDSVTLFQFLILQYFPSLFHTPDVFIAWILIGPGGTENRGAFDARHTDASNSFGILPLK